MLHVNIQRGSGVPLVKQIYDRIRGMILSGDLKAGERLPSTRETARDLGVSRNTAMEAYENLIAEGYLTGVPGSGIYVAEGAKFPMLPEVLADYRVTAYSSEKLAGGVIGFQSGTPALDLFPRGKWGKYFSRALRRGPGFGARLRLPAGKTGAAEYARFYLKKTRGVRCSPEQIIVTSGAKQGLTLVAKCLLRPGSEAWLEDPTNENVRRMFSYHTDRLIPIPVDREGIRPDLFPSSGKPALIFVTPSHQFSAGRNPVHPA